MFKIITMLTVLITAHTSAQVSETRNIQPFSKIEVSDGITVTINQNPATNLVINGHANAELANVSCESNGSTLKISKKNQGGRQIKVVISTPGLVSVHADSGASVSLAGVLQTSALIISLSEKANFSGSIKCGKVVIHAKSGSMFKGRVDTETLSCIFKSRAKAIITGTSNTTSIITDSGGLCHAANFISGNVLVNAGSLSSVIVYAKAKINITMSETSKVAYYGNPLQVKIPENAVVTCKKMADRLLTNN